MNKTLLYMVLIAVIFFVASYFLGFFNSGECGIENCHGLEIECGPNIPQACTEIYQFGDNCRKYTSCEIVDGKCQQVENTKFDECKQCVEECMETFQDPEELFTCEEKCIKYGNT